MAAEAVQVFALGSLRLLGMSFLDASPPFGPHTSRFRCRSVPSDLAHRVGKFRRRGLYLVH